MHMRISVGVLTRLAAPATLLTLAGSAAAQVSISGAVYDGNGGPLLAGTVYHAQTKLDVPAGQTLTVQPGAVVKFKTGLDWNIDVVGTLDVDGTAAEPVVFTSILDDTAGGDTGADGPTAGAPGGWAGLLVHASGVLDAEHAEVRFGGFGGWSSVWCNGGTVDLRHCTIRDADNEGVTFNQQDTPFTRIENCAFVDCEGYALDDVPIEVVPGIRNNTASGCGVDAIRMPGSTGLVVQANTTIGPESCLNGALVVDGVLTVEAGVELVFGAGTVIKVDPSSSTRWVVDGTLRLAGTEGDPVVITSTADDSTAGDTLKDGPTSGAPGDWTGMRATATGAIVADHAVIRHGGKTGETSSSMTVASAGGALTLRDCVVRDCARSAVDASGDDVPIVIERCDFVDNEDYPILDLRWESVAGLLDNTASGNGAGDYVRMASNAVSGDAVVRARNQINGVLVWTNFLNVAPGGKLTLHKGVVLKTDDSDRITISGAIDVLGTPHEPVVFTTIVDDEYAGDTNGDGPSAGAPGAWAGLRIDPSAAASTLRNLRIRYSGNSNPGVWSRSPLTAIRAVRVEHGSRDGFEIDAAASVVNCTAWSNGMQGFNLDSGTCDLVHATASGNGAEGIDLGGLYGGVVRSSIAWGNGGPEIAGATAGELVDSCGDPALAGVDGNLFADPSFANQAGGDLRLTAGSPCVDAASLATALPLVFDAQDHSRALPGAAFQPAVPDMGAFELAHWVLFVQGSAAIGETLTVETIGEDGLALLAFGKLDATYFYPAYGFLTAGVATLIVLPGSTPVNTSFPAPINPEPALIGVDFGLQAIGVSLVSPGFLHFTNLYRGRFEPAL